MGKIFVAFSDYLNFKKCPSAEGKLQYKDFHNETERCVSQTNFSFFCLLTVSQGILTWYIKRPASL